QASGQRHDAGAENDTGNAEHRTVRQIRRQRRREARRRDRCWSDRRDGGAHERCPQSLVRTVTTADNPGRSLAVNGESSRAIFTGTLWVTFVKFPVALSGGSSAN